MNTSSGSRVALYCVASAGVGAFFGAVGMAVVASVHQAAVVSSLSASSNESAGMFADAARGNAQAIERAAEWARYAAEVEARYNAAAANPFSGLEPIDAAAARRLPELEQAAQAARDALASIPPGR